MTYPQDPRQGPQKSTMQSSLDAMANIFAAIAAMILAPLLYDWTIAFFLNIAARSYSRDVLEFLDIVWLFLMYPAVFFTTRATVFVALTSGVSALAFRYA